MDNVIRRTAIRRTTLMPPVEDFWVTSEEPVVKRVPKPAPKVEVKVEPKIETPTVIEQNGSVVNISHLSTAVREIIDHKKNPGGYCAEGRYVNQSGELKKSGSYSTILGGTCHAHVRQYEKPSVHYTLWTGDHVGPGKGSPASKAYFDWVTSDHSPWVNGRPPEIDCDNIRVNNKEFMQRYGFVFWNIDKLPSNVQHQFLIAIRQPAECYYRVAAWHYLVKQGLDPTFAYMWQSLFQDSIINEVLTGRYKKDYPISLAMCNYGEFNLDSSTMKEDGICNFLLHRMDQSKFNRPFKESCYYTPVNRLWGNNEHNPHSAYSGQVCKMYDGKIGTTKSSNSFSGAAAQKFWTGTLDDVVKMGLAEQDRLYTKLDLKARKIA